MNAKRHAASLLLGVVLAACAGTPGTPVPAGSPPSQNPAPSVTPGLTLTPVSPPAAPTPMPVATAAPISTPTPPLMPSSCVRLGVHTVVPGDTLWEIGKRCGVTVEALLAANPQITDRRLIHVGDRITVPPPGWLAGEPHLPLSGIGSAVIDGVLSSEEWAGAARIDFVAAVPPREDGIVTPASLYVMNDATNLYLATVVMGSFSTVTAVFEFDNDDNGVAMEDGDDVILANFDAGQNGPIPLYDDFRYRCPGETTPGRCGPSDTEDGEGYPPPGTEDGAAAGSRAGGITVLEMSHPFAGGDVAHDIQLAPGEAVGFVLSLNIWTECDTKGRCSVETNLPRSRQPVTRIVIQPVPKSGTPDAQSTLPGVVLNTPPAGATIVQNDPSTGCSPNATRGYGHAVTFAWTAPSVEGVSGYQLVVRHIDALHPALDVRLATPGFTWTGCNNFVIDRNLDNWHWQVTALDGANQVLAVSEQRTISFLPCRLSDGTTACSAPG